MRLSAIDRKILNNIQKNFPVCSRPFQLLAKKIDLSEDEVIKRIKKLQKNGVIHRFGASLNHKKLGYYSTLIALKLSPKKLISIAKEITSHPEVTHCYIRKGEYNLWFVFISNDQNKINHFFDELVQKIGKKNILNLLTKKQLKLNTKLQL